MGCFHIGALTDVKPGHWGRHQVSGHGANVSNHVLQSIANFCHHSQVDPGSRIGMFPNLCRHRCGTRTLGQTPSVRPWSQCVKSCFIINCQLLPPFTGGPWFQKWAGSTSVPSKMWNPDTGVDTKCPVMEPMCQVMFYNELPTSATIHRWTLAPEVVWFHIGALTNVRLGHLGRHQVSVHGANVSNHVLQSIAHFCHQSQVDPGSRSGTSPHRCPHQCETWTLGRTPSVRPWSQCVKSCFTINCQLLPPYTSGPWLQKWATSTSVPSPIWNPDTGADTKCPSMEAMCQIMFYDQLPTSETIQKWTLAPEVCRFRIGSLTNVKPLHLGGHKVSGHEANGSNHVL